MEDNFSLTGIIYSTTEKYLLNTYLLSLLNILLVIGINNQMKQWEIRSLGFMFRYTSVWQCALRNTGQSGCWEFLLDYITKTLCDTSFLIFLWYQYSMTLKFKNSKTIIDSLKPLEYFQMHEKGLVMCTCTIFTVSQ